MSLSQVTTTSVIGQEERKDPGTVVRDDRQTRYCGVDRQERVARMLPGKCTWCEQRSDDERLRYASRSQNHYQVPHTRCSVLLFVDAVCSPCRCEVPREACSFVAEYVPMVRSMPLNTSELLAFPNIVTNRCRVFRYYHNICKMTKQAILGQLTPDLVDLGNMGYVDSQT